MSGLEPSKIDNGALLPVKTSFYEGMAGIIHDASGYRFACVAQMPWRWRDPNGLVDATPVRIIDVSPSATVDGMLIVRFERAV